MASNEVVLKPILPGGILSTRQFRLGVFPLVFSKWIGFVFGLSLMLVSGTNYAFGVFSPQYKKIQDYTQDQISMLGTAQNLGFYFGIVTSILQDMAGPRWNLVLSGSMMGTGAWLLWLSNYLAEHMNKKTPVWVAIFFFVLMGQGSSGSYNAAMVTNLINFDPKHRGKIVGIFASAFGICAATYGLMYNLFHKNLSNYLLYLAISMTVVPFISIIPMNKVPKSTKPLETDVEESSGLLTHDSKPAMYTEVDTFSENEEDDDHPQSINAMPPPKKPKKKRFKRGQNVTPVKMLLSLDFWLLTGAMFTSVGSGLLVMLNIGEVVKSYGGVNFSEEEAKSLTSNLVIIISFLNCFGRIAAGVITDLTNAYISRVFWFIVVVFGMAISQFLFAFSTPKMLYASCTVMGMFYGGIFALTPTIASERFGSKYFAINFTFITLLGPAIASVTIATYMQGAIYKYHSIGKKGKVCYGRDCFQLTFIITTALCLIGTLLAFILMISTRHIFYPKRKKKSRSKKNISFDE